jgi:hypothetical protein
VRCAATLVSGQQCSQDASPDSRLCRRHASLQRARDARAFYTTRLSDDDQEALAVAARLDGVDAEIAVLRVLIRRVVSAGDLEAARRGIETLCRTLKARHDLDGDATDRLAISLEHVLDTLGAELGVSL